MRKSVKFAAIGIAALALTGGAVVAADTLDDDGRPLPPKVRVNTKGKDHFSPQVQKFMFAASGARLGVQITDITEELRAFFSAPADAGVLVGRVEKDSAAEKAGIRVGDVIIKVDGTPVAESFDVVRAVGGHEKGDEVPVVLVRNGKQVTLMAKLGEATDQAGVGMLPHGRGMRMWRMDSDHELEERVNELEKRLEKLENRR